MVAGARRPGAGGAGRVVHRGHRAGRRDPDGRKQAEMSIFQRLAGLLIWLFLRRRGPAPRRTERPDARARIVPDGQPAPRAELAVVALLCLAALSAIAFVVVYAVDSILDQTQYLGLALGGAFAFL